MNVNDPIAPWRNTEAYQHGLELGRAEAKVCRLERIATAVLAGLVSHPKDVGEPGDDDWRAQRAVSQARALIAEIDR